LESHLEIGIDRRGFRAVNINLVHEEPLEPLVLSKLLDVSIAARLLVQKLITAHQGNSSEAQQTQAENSRHVVVRLKACCCEFTQMLTCTLHD